MELRALLVDDLLDDGDGHRRRNLPNASNLAKYTEHFSIPVLAITGSNGKLLKSE